MFKINDRIKEKTYSVGSGNLDFSGPTPAYSAFSSVYSSGDTFFYCITNDVDYEIGIGRYAPNRLERTQVFKSSKPANAIVNWPVGLKEVYVTYPAENSVYQVNNINSQNAPLSKNFTYWSSQNAVSDVEGLSFESGKVVSALEFSFSNVIRFSGYNSTQDSPFQKDQLITSTLIDEVIIQSGEVNQHKGFKKQRAGTVLAGPLDNCGSGTCPSGYPIFRPLSAEDVPVLDAENISYTPANPSNWPSVPTNVEVALDLLALGSGAGPTTINWTNITNKPLTFNPTLPISATGITGLGALLILGETSTTAYRGDRGKIAYDHSQASGNPHNLIKADIGLGNVDNTTDLNKPISTLTQTALNSKSNTGHTHTFSDITGNIPISKFNAGSGASSTTVWRGDGTWATFDFNPTMNNLGYGMIIGRENTTPTTTTIQNVAVIGRNNIFSKDSAVTNPCSSIVGSGNNHNLTSVGLAVGKNILVGNSNESYGNNQLFGNDNVVQGYANTAIGQNIDIDAVAGVSPAAINNTVVGYGITHIGLDCVLIGNQINVDTTLNTSGSLFTGAYNLKSIVLGRDCTLNAQETFPAGSPFGLTSFGAKSILIGHGINHQYSSIIELGDLSDPAEKAVIRIGYGSWKVVSGSQWNRTKPFAMFPISDLGAIVSSASSHSNVPTEELPSGMMAFRRSGNSIFIDINTGGTTKTLSLGTAT